VPGLPTERYLFTHPWVLSLGWKRIVVTVGEKIGKTHLTYDAAAEVVAMVTIASADHLGLPVSDCDRLRAVRDPAPGFLEKIPPVKREAVLPGIASKQKVRALRQAVEARLALRSLMKMPASAAGIALPKR
jgi:hypothetical protein